MRLINRMRVGIALMALTPAAVLTQQPIVYPAKGQSADQQQKDEGECYTWSKKNTGIDPAALAAAPPPAPSGPGGERVRGAARGAVGGAIIGEIASDDAGKGAGIGAVAGTMAGGRQARQNQAAQQQQAQNQKQQQINTYYRAFGACMEGRGYTIK
jgi:YmgG-like glycine-zipper protein